MPVRRAVLTENFHFFNPSLILFRYYRDMWRDAGKTPYISLAPYARRTSYPMLSGVSGSSS